MSKPKRLVGFKRTLLLALAIILNLTAASTYSADITSSSKRLILHQGFILSAYYNDRYIEVKRLKPGAQFFYGYGWLDDDKVFVAYQSLDLVAHAEMEIVDLRHGRTTRLEGIGGVGEATFDVNLATGHIVYSTGDDINIIKIDPKINSYQNQTVTNTDCWGAFWIDDKTIGCKLFDKEGKSSSLVKYSVP